MVPAVFSVRGLGVALAVLLISSACSTTTVGGSDRRSGTFGGPAGASGPVPAGPSAPTPAGTSPKAPSAQPLSKLAAGAIGVKPSAESLAAETAERAAGLRAFRAQARLTYDGPESKFKSSQMIVVKAPNQVRIDIMGPFGPSYTVASDGSRLTAYDRGEKILYSGDASLDNVTRYTRVALDVPVLASLLRGLPPQADLTRAVVVRSEQGWVLQVPLPGDRRMSIVYAFEHFDPVYVKLSEAIGGRAVEAYFSDFHDVDGVRTPHEVEVVLADGGRANLVYEKIWRGVAISDGAFRIDPAKGVRYVDMDEAG